MKNPVKVLVGKVLAEVWARRWERRGPVWMRAYTADYYRRVGRTDATAIWDELFG